MLPWIFSRNLMTHVSHIGPLRGWSCIILNMPKRMCTLVICGGGGVYRKFEGTVRCLPWWCVDAAKLLCWIYGVWGGGWGIVLFRVEYWGKVVSGMVMLWLQPGENCIKEEEPMSYFAQGRKHGEWWVVCWTLFCNNRSTNRLGV